MSQNEKSVELNVVGSSTFGRYPKISQERTYNMFISDGWMVPYAGYKNESTIVSGGDVAGRAIYTSNILNGMIFVCNESVYLINSIYNPVVYDFVLNSTLIGTMDVHNSDVFIAENPKGQIAISDTFDIYIYDQNHTPAFYKAQSYTTSSATFSPLNFKPGYITYQDGRFISPSLGKNKFRLSNSYDLLISGQIVFPTDLANEGTLNTKPDTVIATLRVPSRGNMLYVFGSNVVEVWFDQGLQGFPYERSQSFNIDYGCLNASTIASNDEYVVWLAQNEKSGPIILASEGGGSVEKITTDGIDYLLSSLTYPQLSEAFMYRQDGHLFYHINFYRDNLSLFYDFNTKKFYHACDQNGNYFIAKEVAFYNNQYYFVTANNGNIYSFDTAFTTFDGHEIPRYRICKSIRFPGQDRFIINDIGFTIEQGTTDYTYVTQTLPLVTTAPFPNPNPPTTLVAVTPRIDISVSYDGGQSFSSFVSQDLNPIGSYRNMLNYFQLGMANDFTVQIRYHGMGRFLATNGLVNIR